MYCKSPNTGKQTSNKFSEGDYAAHKSIIVYTTTNIGKKETKRKTEKDRETGPFGPFFETKIIGKKTKQKALSKPLDTIFAIMMNLPKIPFHRTSRARITRRACIISTINK